MRRLFNLLLIFRRSPPKVDPPKSEDRQQYNLLQDERSSSNDDESHNENSSEPERPLPDGDLSQTAHQTIVTFDDNTTTKQQSKEGKVGVKSRCNFEQMSEGGRPSKTVAMCTIVFAILTSSTILVLIFLFHNVACKLVFKSMKC